MTNKLDNGDAGKSIVPCHPPLQPTPNTTHSNAINAIFTNSLQVAKLELKHLTIDGLSPNIELEDRQLQHILPPLRGAYSVGHNSFEIEGSLGDERVGVEVFAPTHPDLEGQPLPVFKPDLHPQDKMNLTQGQLDSFLTHSLDGINPIDDMPFIIFSHGMGVPPVAYLSFLEELASHGYVVLSLNHPSSTGDPLFEKGSPDWGVLDRSKSDFSPEKADQEMDRIVLAQAANIRSVINHIREEMGHGDTSRIVLVGHSLGGAASITAARIDSNVKACINLDGQLLGPDKTKGLTVPLLTISTDHPATSDLDKKVANEWATIHENSPDSKFIKIENTQHMDFAMVRFYDWLSGANILTPTLKAHAVASREILNWIH